jgi:hypothetical protein
MLESTFFMKTKSFEIFYFLKISEFSLIDDEVRVFRKTKLLSNPVSEIKIRDNHSHCRSIQLMMHLLFT